MHGISNEMISGMYVYICLMKYCLKLGPTRPTRHFDYSQTIKHYIQGFLATIIFNSVLTWYVYVFETFSDFSTSEIIFCIIFCNFKNIWMETGTANEFLRKISIQDSKLNIPYKNIIPLEIQF